MFPYSNGSVNVYKTSILPILHHSTYNITTMAEVFRVDIGLLEKGIAHLRNAPPCAKVPHAHWPHEQCMCCNRTSGDVYVGQALVPVLNTRSIHLMGPGYFCDRCEIISRAITSILQEWGLISDTAEEWEVITRRPGNVVAHQMHLCQGMVAAPVRHISFKQQVGSRLYRYTRERILESRLSERSDQVLDDEIIDLTMD